MDRIWRQLAIATNWPVLVAVAALLFFGEISIWAHSRVDSRFADDPKKQLIFIAIGVGCMLLMQAFNYLHIGRYTWPFYLFSLLLLVYTLIPGLPGSQEHKGTRAWINFGQFKLQPAELTKIAFCMVLARYLRFRSNYRTLAGLLPPFALAMAPLLLILKQPDLGTALVFIPALFIMLFAAGARLKHLLAIVAMGMAFGWVIWLSGPKPDGPDLPLFRHLPALVKGYQRLRVQAMFTSDPAIRQKTGFQQEEALIAFGSGGISGQGALNIPVGAHVPEAHNDMIFALIGEQFGFFGGAGVLAAYLVLFATGLEIASATKEPFGRLVAVGIVALLAGQTFINLLVCLRLMPVTGITLPFVSYGGSSLLASFMAAGLLLNIGQNRPLVIARAAFEFD